MDRQTIMETNRSLRTIKNELESLLEKGVINEAAFDTIHSALPAEAPLRGAAPGNAARSATQTPVQNLASATPPVQAFQNLNVNGTSPAPPSYEDTPAPNVPTRSTAKPVLAHARALYRYNASDARDLGLEKDDKVGVYEYMNQDWWMGRNHRTGLEGIFPQNYVFVEQEQKAPPPAPAPAAYPQQPTYGYPVPSQGPPAQQNPYNASVPPMAIAEGGQPNQQGGDGNSKVGEYGKKFGKKLGNAAIFGAGASIGSNIVNSIF
ncbi:SH3 domain-containing protein [Trichoderma ceciliae]